MARIQPVEKPGWLVRLAAWVSGRRYGRIPHTLYLQGHNQKVLAGFLAYSALLESSKRVPTTLKRLVHIRVAMRIGCPF